MEIQKVQFVLLFVVGCTPDDFTIGTYETFNSNLKVFDFSILFYLLTDKCRLPACKTTLT